MKTAIYPGTFDPITNGHIDLVKRALRLFDKIIVAIAKRSENACSFSLDERVKMALEGLPVDANLKVMPFSGLMIDFAREQSATAVIRGLRAVSDFEYEFQLASMNRHLDKSLETVFLTPDERYAFLSSSLVKEVASLGGDISAFVPASVLKLSTKKSTLE